LYSPTRFLRGWNARGIIQDAVVDVSVAGQLPEAVRRFVLQIRGLEPRRRLVGLALFTTLFCSQNTS
jgi:hypothetical protein